MIDITFRCILKNVYQYTLSKFNKKTKFNKLFVIIEFTPTRIFRFCQIQNFYFFPKMLYKH